MRIEFIPKTHAKILSVEAMSEKKGQTDMVPAVAVTLLLSLPTDKMAILHGRRDFKKLANPGQVAVEHDSEKLIQAARSAQA